MKERISIENHKEMAKDLYQMKLNLNKIYSSLSGAYSNHAATVKLTSSAIEKISRLRSALNNIVNQTAETKTGDLTNIYYPDGQIDGFKAT